MSWFKENMAGLGIMAGAVLFGGTIFLAQGCSIDDFVKADIPREVQTELGVPPRVPLSQARDIIEEYNQKVERKTKDQVASIARMQRDAAAELSEVTAAWEKKMEDAGNDLQDFKRASERVAASLAARVDHANEVAGFVGSLVNMGVGAAQASGLGALPGGGILLAGLTGLAGLMIRKPGTQREVDAAYEEGRRAALEAVKETKS